MTEDMALYAIIFGSLLTLVIVLVAVAVGRRRRKGIITDQAAHPGRDRPDGRILSQHEQRTPVVQHRERVQLDELHTNQEP